MSNPEKRLILSGAQWSVVALSLVIAIGSIAYRVIVWGRLEQTALLFIGIPTLLAICLAALAPKTKSLTAKIIIGITLALLLSGPLLGEGFVCILMASPLFLLVGVIVGLLCDHLRNRRRATVSCLLLVLLPMSIEGTTPRLSFNRTEAVEVTRTVANSSAEVAAALARTPHFNSPLPFYLRLGFPRPVAAWGEGLQAGATRTIHFGGGEGRPGDLVMVVEESGPGFVRFRAASDRSKIAHWLDWKSAEVRWTALDATHTSVTWKLTFQRQLDPAWYFRPWERYAVSLAADYLIASNAVPSNAMPTGRMGD